MQQLAKEEDEPVSALAEGVLWLRGAEVEEKQEPRSEFVHSFEELGREEEEKLDIQIECEQQQHGRAGEELDH